MAASRAPAIDELAAARDAAGSLPTASWRWLLYCDAAMEPSTATPSAAPSSRVASFMAEPAPARRAGTAAMIAEVMGDIDIAMPETSGMSMSRMTQ